MLLVFIAYAQIFIDEKQANFNPLGVIFSPNYSDIHHLRTTSIDFKLYSSKTVSKPQI